MPTLDVETPAGLARVDLTVPRGARALLLMGHGAGGGIDAPDITTVAAAALAAGCAVGRVLQPYRVRGIKAPPAAPRLDEAWLAIGAAVRRRRGLARVPLITGGRSSGARVACRCATEQGVVGVIALAFPVHPPGRPDKTRLPELTAVSAPVLVVQGDADPFGCPPPDSVHAPGRVHVIAGADHGLKRDRAGIAQAATEFLTAVL